MPAHPAYALFMFLALVVFVVARRFVPKPAALARVPWWKQALLALAVGRWGCFFNGCCYGVVTTLPWGVDFGDGIPRHPTQIYESLFHATMAGVLIVIARRGLIPHQRLKLYLIAYCGYRFLTEFIRPEPTLAGGLTFYQWFVLPCAAALMVQWWYDARQLRRASSPLSPGGRGDGGRGIRPPRLANRPPRGSDRVRGPTGGIADGSP